MLSQKPHTLDARCSRRCQYAAFLAPSRADGKFRGLETNSWYCKWLEKHIDAVLVRPNLAFDMARVIIDELLSAGILRQLLGPRGMPVWGFGTGGSSGQYSCGAYGV